MSVIRVLIADDSAEWRDFILNCLIKNQRFEIVGEAQDGVEAIELATQTKPTIILLDVRMPSLNGLEAARQILALEPEARVIFLTGESDHDFVTAALDTGAMGYVLKGNANRDLPIAIDKAIEGIRFVSKGLPNGSPERESTEHDKGGKSARATTTKPEKLTCGQYWD